MGKKGVKLDNGRNAQSSMALYWKKHNEQSKKPKKEYEPTEEEQLDQRAESGFQKWKMHREKMIEKAYVKKQQKPVSAIKEQGNQKEEEQWEQDETFAKQHKTKGIVKIPGFKSKDALKEKLRPQSTKEVSQADNVLKLPAHLSDISQEDIIRILKEKKAQNEMAKRKKKNEEVEDVILGEDFLESFKAPPKEDEAEKLRRMEEEKAREAEKKKQEKFFKSDILNQISKGNTSVILPKAAPEPIAPTKQEPEIAVEVKEVKEEKAQPHIRPLFKPRILGHK